MAHADGVVDNLGHGGVPVLARAVIEHGVLAHAQVLDVAVGHSGHDVHLGGFDFRLAVAVDQIESAEACRLSLLAHILHADAEV